MQVAKKFGKPSKLFELHPTALLQTKKADAFNILSAFDHCVNWNNLLQEVEHQHFSMAEATIHVTHHMHPIAIFYLYARPQPFPKKMIQKKN